MILQKSALPKNADQVVDHVHLNSSDPDAVGNPSESLDGCGKQLAHLGLKLFAQGALSDGLGWEWFRLGRVDNLQVR